MGSQTDPHGANYLATDIIWVSILQDNVDYEVQRMEQLYGDYWETLDEPINCLALHLRTIEIRNFRGKKLEDELARFLATNGKALARMTVSTPSATFSGFDFI